MSMENIRKQFPILKRKIHNKPLIYLDNAATTHKPLCVINAIVDFYSLHNANPDRGFHTLGIEASSLIERSRKAASRFINAKDSLEIVFTAGTTEGLNIIASSFLKDTPSVNEVNRENVVYGSVIQDLRNNFKDNEYITDKDFMFISDLEHHSNILPWMVLCKKKGATIKSIPITQQGCIDICSFEQMLKKYHPKIVAITYVSNVLGSVNDISKISKLAHQYGAKVVCDAAQAAPHIAIDVQNLDCDFLVFSAHKMYGPTGVGILYAKKEVLDKLQPHKYGGGMAENISLQNFDVRAAPFGLESGTLNIAGIVALYEAIQFINNTGIEQIAQHEHELKKYLEKELQAIPEIIIPTPDTQGPIVSFHTRNMHHLDIGTLLDAYGIAIRTGHHCAKPLLDILNVGDGISRVSLAVYNTKEEIGIFIEKLKKIIRK